MNCSKTRWTRKAGGFTLIEVLVAMAVIALVTVVLLNQRVDIVRDAGVIRDRRVAWMLAGWKMGEIALDPILFQSTGRTDAGGFERLSADYGEFSWNYEALQEEVILDDAPVPDPAAIKRIFRVKLRIVGPEQAELYTLEAMFPVKEAAVPVPSPAPDNP